MELLSSKAIQLLKYDSKWAEASKDAKSFPESKKKYDQEKINNSLGADVLA